MAWNSYLSLRHADKQAPGVARPGEVAAAEQTFWKVFAEVAAGGASGLPAKPDPAVVHAVFTQLGRAPGLRPAEQWDVMIGDTDYDMLAGRRE